MSWKFFRFSPLDLNRGFVEEATPPATSFQIGETWQGERRGGRWNSSPYSRRVWFFPLGSYQWDVTIDRDARAKLIVHEKFRPRRGGRQEGRKERGKKTKVGREEGDLGRLWKSGGAFSTREVSSFLAWQRPPTSLFLGFSSNRLRTASSAATWSILSSSVFFPSTYSRIVFFFFLSFSSFRVELTLALNFFFRMSGCRIFFSFFLIKLRSSWVSRFNETLCVESKVRSWLIFRNERCVIDF